MKNITITVSDELYRTTRVRAAEQGTTVTAIVRGIIEDLAARETGFERLAREEIELRAALLASGRGLRGAERMAREDVHSRRHDDILFHQAAE